jgi:signal transduction histidine kinase
VSYLTVEALLFIDFVFLVLLVPALYWLVRWVRMRARRQERTQHMAEVGVLASGLVHEAKNVLNAMRAHVALARKNIDRDSEKVRRYVDQLDQSIADLDRLFRDFLAFARPPASQFEAVDLAAIAEEVLGYVGLDLEQAGVRVERFYEAGLPRVWGDREKLKRVLLNLIVNARQAMGEGGLLRVSVRRASKRRVALEVADTGCGMSEETKAKLFQLFFTTKPQGTGLGLAIVKKTVEELNGLISVESELGKGTTVTIVLPAHGG